MDVRASEVAVASTRQVLRLRGLRIVQHVRLDPWLHAERGLRITFVDDLDGDRKPEIQLDAPYASLADRPKETGVVQVIGSRTGEIIRTQPRTAARSPRGN
jgi:hypothetical protein